MKYPAGIQSFAKIRQNGFAYIDKTAYIYQMATTNNCYFLSRPRRFGKSLLVSTLEAYFKGQKELFEGLAIANLEKDWAAYPVLHFDMTGADYESVDMLEQKLNSMLSKYEDEFGLLQTEELAPLRFESLIYRLHKTTGRQVVVLVDEYDKPLLETIDQPELQKSIRARLGNFYSVLKKCDEHLRFVFLTGVTKFSKLSIFSGLNNLTELTFDAQYAAICGITEEELRTSFDEGIAELAQKLSLSKEEAYAKLKKNYDGYHFEHDAVGVYNPFSIVSALCEGAIKNYWFTSGAPSFLFKLLQANDYRLSDLQNAEATMEQLGSADALSLLPIFFQSGYLSIRGYDKDFETYHLGYPNTEVEESFTRSMEPWLLQTKDKDNQFDIRRFVTDAKEGRAEEFMERVQWLFDDSNYKIVGKAEKYFQNCIYLIFKLMSFHVEVEHHTTRGRIDVVVRTPRYVYIIECKCDSSARKALDQIEEKGYAIPYEHDERKVFRIGINFSTEKRTIDDWKIE